MIPDEAVEAALGELSPTDAATVYPDAMRAALEAAPPHLLAAAWLEGYSAGEVDGALGANGHEPPDQRNPYRKARK